MDLSLVGQLVVSTTGVGVSFTLLIYRGIRRLPAGGLYELPLEVEYSALTDFIDYLQIVVLSLGLQLGGPVDVGLALHGVLVLQVQPVQWTL